MKKNIYSVLILLVFFISPIRTDAITQSAIDASVLILCPDNYGNWYSGSGTIIDSKGIVLTNKHVVIDKFGNAISTCVIGFTTSISATPSFYTGEDLNLAEVKYYTSSSDLDAALLYLDNPTNIQFPYINIWDSNSDNIFLGEKIEVVGYPSIGGSTITYTSGDFSGYGSYLDGTANYIKASVPLEHGNSGGGAYNASGQFIGIPTMVMVGSLNLLSYILSVNSVKSWLSGVLGSSYKQEVIEHTPVIQEAPQYIPDDNTPPSLKGYEIKYEIVNNDTEKRSYIQYSIPRASIGEAGTVKRIYYYFGDNKFADPLLQGESFEPALSGDITIPNQFQITDEDLFFIVKLQDSSGNISDAIVAPWKVSQMLEVGVEYALYNDAIRKFQGSDYRTLDKYSGRFIKNNEEIWWVSPKDKVRFIVYHPDLGVEYPNDTIHVWLWSNWSGLAISTGIISSDLKQRPRSVWGQLLVEFKDDGSGFAEGTECEDGCYINPINGEFINFKGVIDYGKKGDGALRLIDSLAVNISDKEINSIEPLGSNNLIHKNIQWAIDHNQIPKYVYTVVESQSSNDDFVNRSESSDFISRLKGFILLQVEEHGEAWYVDPTTERRYYMKDGPTAYEMMRYFGLGITNADLERVKAGNVTLINRLKGRILLQVEAHGEAYWIHPVSGEAHYLKDGAEAYRLMRFYSLGITNNDLNKIPIRPFVPIGIETE